MYQLLSFLVEIFISGVSGEYLLALSSKFIKALER
jgi:hypothetical protein